MPLGGIKYSFVKLTCLYLYFGLENTFDLHFGRGKCKSGEVFEVNFHSL